MEQLAQLVVVLLAGALIINLIQGGTGQVGAWLRAKFLGKAA